MELLNNIIQLAILDCFRDKLPIDIYNSADGKIKSIQSVQRTSTEFIYKLSYENNQVLVKNSNGKVIRTEGEKQDKKASKKKPPVAKDI